MPPDEQNLSPQARNLLRQIRARTNIRKQKRQCFFPFANLPPSRRLQYELTAWHNYTDYLVLFQNDGSLFVDKRFKNRDLLDEYAVGLLEIMYYNVKRAGCDWIIRLHDRTPVGILHLYDLSNEQETLTATDSDDDFYDACSIGYAIAEPYRRQGYACEACTHLLQHIAATFGRYKVQATVEATNKASAERLQKLGFKLIGQGFKNIKDSFADTVPLLIFGKNLTL